MEELSQQNVASHLLRLSQYGLRAATDFDKYHAMHLAEDATREAHRVKDDKATFLEAAVQTLRSHIAVPREQFQAYFTALFCDKDYTKVLESIARVNKALKTTSPGPSRSAAQTSRTRRQNGAVCFYCGTSGHIASTCFRRRRELGGQSGSWRDRRYTPYPRSMGPPQQNQSSNYPQSRY